MMKLSTSVPEKEWTIHGATANNLRAKNDFYPTGAEISTWCFFLSFYWLLTTHLGEYELKQLEDWNSASGGSPYLIQKMRPHGRVSGRLLWQWCAQGYLSMDPSSEAPGLVLHRSPHLLSLRNQSSLLAVENKGSNAWVWPLQSCPFSIL